jgi:alkanesulfonate monooxygenase SsuD/methylene tetrahydromethanopterin reductase-like flavin-dependent oxidoreductase (luciferase family)
MIDAYLEALPQGRPPRILASRTLFVADDREEALRLAEIGLARQRARYAAIGRMVFVEACRCTTRSPLWISISATRTT